MVKIRPKRGAIPDRALLTVVGDIGFGMEKRL